MVSFFFVFVFGFFVGFTDIMIFMVTFSAKAGSDMISKFSSHAVRQKEMLSMMRSFFVEMLTIHFGFTHHFWGD